jgi:hypothetical protein
MRLLLTFLVAYLAFFGLPWTERAIQTPVYGSCFFPPNACLINATVSVAFSLRFAQNLMLFLYRIHREIASGRLQIEGRQHIYPATWNVVHWLPRYASTIIYSCIMLPQQLHERQRQSRKLWIPHRTSGLCISYVPRSPYVSWMGNISITGIWPNSDGALSRRNADILNQLNLRTGNVWPWNEQHVGLLWWSVTAIAEL